MLKQTLKKNRPILMTHECPSSIIAEQFRVIRTNIHFSLMDRKHKTLLVTSPGFAEGRTTTVINLAVSMAQEGQKVLVIDADLRRPAIQSAFKIKRAVGLTNVLAGEITLAEAVVSPTGIENVWVLASGPVPFNYTELLTVASLGKLIQTAQEQFDVVLLDAPPVLEVTGTRILANQCDGVLLVLRRGKTREEKAVEAKKVLEFSKANVLGVVLNRR